MGIESEMRAETCPAVLTKQLCNTIKQYEEQLLNAAKGKPEKMASLRWSRANIPYEVIAPFMTRERLMQLGQQKSARRILQSLSSSRLHQTDRFLFWEDMLSAVEELPVEWRAKIFLDCLHSNNSWDPRERNGKIPYYTHVNHDKEELARYVVSSPWLVDAPLVRKWYCLLHKPGYELLACIDQKQTINYPMREKLLECIEKDDLPGFGLNYAFCGRVPNWTLLQDILQKGASKIFSWLLEDKPELFSAVKPYHLMIYSVANLPPKAALVFVARLERSFPGTVFQIDELGNNLLWYSLHNRKKNDDSYPHAPSGRTIDKNPMGKLITYLCRCGCRMDSRNHLGLSYGDICQAITFAKFNFSLDDYKELVFLALLEQFSRLSKLEAREAANREMLEYQDEDFQKFYNENFPPNVVAAGMVMKFL